MSKFNFQIRPAERKQAKLRLALIGVSGSGKTTGAIKIAVGMGKKFVLIDTERKSADLFSDLAKFDVLNLQKPYTPELYIEAIKHCEAQGYETIIIDSLSHAWAGEGGVLDMQDAATQSSKTKNSYTAWREVTPWHNKLIDAMLQSNAHIITTMRVKTHYEIVIENGKAKPIKIGLAPIQREGMDYEFTTVLDIDKDSHLYSSSKDRTKLFEGKHDVISEETGIRLIEWLNEGKSFSEVEAEEKAEIEKIKAEIIMAATMEKLKRDWNDAKRKYPSHSDEFTKIATQRRHELENRLTNEDVPQ
ncbi:ATP-binding protein [Candidatus Parcubacteria bacterium]|nr:ATP-binding protein [Candidatus Parcubacteria bacterium]